MSETIARQVSMLRQRLETHFSADTAAKGFSWRSEVPSTGHCAAVTVIAHVAFGAEMQSAVVQGLSHWFMRVSANGLSWDVDVTGDQFGAPPVQVAPAGSLYPEVRARTLTDIDQETLQRARRLAERAELPNIVSTLDVVAELLELRRCFEKWSALPGTRRSGPPALELIEGPLKAFFGKVAPNNVLVGKGDRPARDPRYSTDMDIVFDYENSSWTARFRMDVQTSPVLAHIDVSARSDWDSSKLCEDLERLQQTIDEARDLGRKTWTGLIAVGSGFRERSSEIMKQLHEFYHTRRVDEWSSPQAGSVWPFVDAVVIPGMCLKKHDLFERPQIDSRRWPVFYPFPVGGFPSLGELWPLVPARAFLASYLRKAIGEEQWDAPAWCDSDTPVIMGGAPTVGDWPKDWRVITLRDTIPSQLHHWTGRPELPWQDHVRFSDATCSSGSPYLLLPRPTFSLTEERRQQFIAILTQDPRWHRLNDAGSKLIAEFAFPEGLEEEINRLVENARSLGYEAEAHMRFVKAKGAPRTFSVSISIPDKASSMIPDSLRTLRTVLHPNLSRATRISPQLQLTPFEGWLEARQWRYDADDVITKSIGNAVVFAFREKTTQQSLVLLVLGDTVEMLPLTME